VLRNNRKGENVGVGQRVVNPGIESAVPLPRNKSRVTSRKTVGLNKRVVQGKNGREKGGQGRKKPSRIKPKAMVERQRSKRKGR